MELQWLGRNFVVRFGKLACAPQNGFNRFPVVVQWSLYISEFCIVNNGKINERLVTKSANLLIKKKEFNGNVGFV